MQNGGKGSLSLKLPDCGMTSLGGDGNKGRVAVSHLLIPKTQLLAEQINLWLARRGQPCLCLLIGQNSDFLFTSSATANNFDLILEGGYIWPVAERLLSLSQAGCQQLSL